ncbi:MAG TPA: DinB family protein [Rhodothermales bacterium]|nr:DinB family protein [Rhodothermales bacterium]
MDSRSAPRSEGEVHAILTDQLAYLLDEVEALAPVIGRVPEKILSGRPREDEWSIKEIYGLIATADAQVRLPNLEYMITEDEPDLAELDEAALIGSASPWGEREIGDILQQVRSARTALVQFLRGLPASEWGRTGTLEGQRLAVRDYAYRIAQEDTDYFRTLGRRLHESHLTSRPQDLPK